MPRGRKSGHGYGDRRRYMSSGLAGIWLCGPQAPSSVASAFLSVHCTSPTLKQPDADLDVLRRGRGRFPLRGPGLTCL